MLQIAPTIIGILEVVNAILGIAEGNKFDTPLDPAELIINGVGAARDRKGSTSPLVTENVPGLGGDMLER